MATRFPKPEWDQAAAFWDSEAGETGVWHQAHDIDPVMFKVLKTVRNKRILEIGCGNGYFSRMLARRGAKVTGTDLSSKMIGFAKMREKTKPLGINYLIHDAANLRGIKSGTFDLVVGNMCLMDIQNAQGAIREASRTLKPGGRFVFSISHPFLLPHSKQLRTIITKNKQKYFGYAIYKYLSPSAEKFVVWASGAHATAYHRSIGTYIKYLRSAGFLIDAFEEIATKKKLKKAGRGDRVLKWNWSKYRTMTEKKAKAIANKELPRFLVIGAVKAPYQRRPSN
jgi:2-polyprenyl-3-methyl-5-hydroxy-6-metoxy-1,4-benzoquinol methylase